ncbi:MAG: hypothetical protein IKX97_02055 [Erysipelotrichaceae bacterium]|nr:hypothetical protein [Erysipelotrichaceae bacterium]
MIRNSKKIWKIKGFEGVFTDEEIVELIKSGQIKGEYALSSRDMKKWVKVKDSIYQFYLEDKGNETVQ